MKSKEQALESAYEVLQDAIFHYHGEPLGTVAARDPYLVAPNYEECFVRDFVPSALVFLMDGEYAIVRNFLRTVLDLRAQQRVMEGHQRAPGLMPASFKVVTDADGEERLVADFGDLAIGRVAPVDSALWWMILLRLYTLTTGDRSLVDSPRFQEGIRTTLDLYLKESFETSPAMLVPDASFMIDRRMSVYGHPLEIQALFYAALRTALDFLHPTEANARLRKMVLKRFQTLRSYVRIYYWLDLQRLNEIHRYHAEEFGHEAVNVFNIYPESIPDWLDGWLDNDTGYLVGNLGPGRMDFRHFAFGNLLAVIFGLAAPEQAQRITALYDRRWDDLVGHMPVKILFPAAEGKEWAFITGNDPKNVPWSYHNGGSWPALLWAFTGAALLTGRGDLAERGLQLATQRLPADNWPEYYDGRHGGLIGRRANYYQTWSAAAYIIARRLLEDEAAFEIFRNLAFDELDPEVEARILAS